MKINLLGYVIEFSCKSLSKIEFNKGLERGNRAVQSSVFKERLIKEFGMPIERVPACFLDEEGYKAVAEQWNINKKLMDALDRTIDSCPCDCDCVVSGAAPVGSYAAWASSFLEDEGEDYIPTFKIMKAIGKKPRKRTPKKITISKEVVKKLAKNKKKK
jgi:hypothetical protein